MLMLVDIKAPAIGTLCSEIFNSTPKEIFIGGIKHKNAESTLNH